MKGEKQSGIRGLGRVRRVHIALLLVLLVLASSWVKPYSGVLERIFPREEPCTLADQIRASNTRAPVGGCPAGTGVDSIQFDGNVTLREPLPPIKSTVIIEGRGYTIDGDAQFRIFTVLGGRLKIRDLTLYGGAASVGGAIKLSENANVILSRSTVINSAAGQGGGIASLHSELDVVDSRFFDNNATWYGGAIHSVSSTLTIRNSEFVGNSGLDGGAVSSIRSWVAVFDSAFRENGAEIGGAIYAEDAEIELQFAAFENNEATINGAAIYQKMGSLAVTDGSVSGNEITEFDGSGGAVSGRNASISILRSVFSDNYGADYGGAIQIVEGILDLRNSRLSANKARYGGAVYAKKANAYVADSDIEGNVGQSDGGGIYSSGESLKILNSTLGNNKSLNGGGVFSDDEGLEIQASTLHGNRADYAGGAIRVNRGTATIRSSTLEENRAGSYGGGIYVQQGDLILVKSALDANEAGRLGGGAFGEAEAALEFENSTIMNNSAGSYGGGVFLRGGHATLTHVTLFGNSVRRSGGGLFSEDGAFNLRNSIVAGNSGGDCNGLVAENVHNLISDRTCEPLLADDPMLAAMSGSPAYFPLRVGSFAIDAAHPENCPETDQRGVRRPQGEACDIGAYEVKAED